MATSASHGIALVAVLCTAAAEGKASNMVKPSWVQKGVLMESGCSPCFPSDRQACGNELWGRCCLQEVVCHKYHCRQEILGKLQVGNRVRVRADFVSDDEEKAQITKGMSGRVLRVDGEGGAYIKFQDDEYDEDFQHHWVFKTTFWDSLELPGKSVRLRADRTAACLDNCTVAQQCSLQHMSKKKAKVYQACLGHCKLDKCNADPDCKGFVQAYAACKQRTSESLACRVSAEDGYAESQESDEL